VRRIFFLVAVLASCGGGGGGSDPPATKTATTEFAVVGTPGSGGVFDPAPMSDGTTNLWMSYSMVRPSPNLATMNQVRTRIASSPDRGVTWTDLGIDPNGLSYDDFQVPDGSGGAMWATWRYEVSRILHDPADIPSRRWKLLWHRVLAIGAGPIFQDGWVGLATAPAVGGPWSAERKLFTGSAYDSADMDAFIGAPEFPLASLHAAQLGGCPVFTEPGMLARSDGIYVSLQCAPTGKIFLLRCDRAFSSCAYLGDLLGAGEAAQFSLAGQSLNGFSASELVDVGATTYLIVTGYEPPPAPTAAAWCFASPTLLPHRWNVMLEFRYWSNEWRAPAAVSMALAATIRLPAAVASFTARPVPPARSSIFSAAVSTCLDRFASRYAQRRAFNYVHEFVEQIGVVLLTAFRAHHANHVVVITGTVIDALAGHRIVVVGDRNDA
jgi:hypothetical protein